MEEEKEEGKDRERGMFEKTKEELFEEWRNVKIEEDEIVSQDPTLFQLCFFGETTHLKNKLENLQNNAASLINKLDETTKWSSVHVAAARGFKVILQYLLNNGGDPNCVDGEGLVCSFDFFFWNFGV